MAPASHPQAQFIPIPPDFDIHALVETTSNFDYVTRLSTEKLKEHSIQSFEALVLAVVIQSGKPLVIEDWGESLPPWLFNSTWLQDNLGTKVEQIRDIPNEVNIPMTMGHYLRSMETLANRITPATYRDSKRQRLYMKDIDCPDKWFDHLKEIMPESVFYFNDCIEPRTGGDGAIREPNEYGQMVYGKGVAPAGDLMSSLPPEMRAMNMMCYVGHEGTYTPAHREMCASLGHNIMVEASENRKGEKAGSSVWFMTETKEREVVSEYFLSMLGHDIEVEKHFAQLNAWKKAPFNVWVVEQKVGDLILIPPLAPHQVWNRGTRTMKAAWNRTTVDTLELALHEALPRARLVCREEQYKNKAIVYYTLLKYHDLLQRDTVESKMWKYGRIKQVLEDFKRLFALYGEILVSEMFSPKLPEEVNVEYLQYDSNVTCSYCRGNIFNRFLTCKSCIQSVGEIEDTYDVCMDCYAMGRSCACISNLKWVEQWPWETLVQNYDTWRATVIQFDGFFDKYRSPQPLDIARKQYGRKPVAEVCQEQLQIRPWKDITQPDVEPIPLSEEEPDVDDEGRVKKKKKNTSMRNNRGRVIATKNKTTACHICCHHDYNWKLAFCTTCTLAYCYGTLWRAFDMMPQTVMEDKEWSCPRCLKICSCGKCRKDSRQKPYAPKGTLLGHDTKKVADYRSVESLVDFSKTNLAWLRGENDNDPHESSRMKKLKALAEAEKDRIDETNGRYLEGMGSTALSANMADGHQYFNSEIDPELLDYSEESAAANGHHNELQHALSDAIRNRNERSQTAFHEVNPNQNIHSMTNESNFDDDTRDSHNRPQAAYQTGLLAHTVPQDSTQEIYPDPIQVGRMMGAGLYQQGSGVDRILFDTPNENASPELSQQHNPNRNPNFLFSDLVDPSLKSQEGKKRKRMGQDGVEDEEEFFTSKKQMKAAREKKVMVEYGLEEEISTHAHASHRQPRRRTATTTYVDLGEDAVPIEDDEGPSALRREPRRKPNDPTSDVELAAKALTHLSEQIPGDGSTKKRGRPKGSVVKNATSQSKTSKSNTIKTPRKSAWLARKEAAESGETPSTDPGKRTRHSRGSLQNVQTVSASVDNLSGSNESENDGFSLQEQTDSLFGEPIDFQRDNSDDAGIRLTPSEGSLADLGTSTPRIEISAVPEPTFVVPSVERSNVQNPLSRKRGRPPKNPKPIELNSESPAVNTVAPLAQMMSLKERLSLQGKAAKIVSKQPKSTGASVEPSNSRTTPTGSSKPILKSEPLPSPIPVWSKFGDDDDDVSNEELEDVTDPSSSSNNGSVRSPVHKAPTIVRLMSPTPEEEERLQVDVSSQSSSSSDSSDSGSDVSIPAVRVAPNSARRGGTAFRSRGAIRGGMTARRGRPPGSRNK